jgi:hypothetical protein
MLVAIPVHASPARRAVYARYRTVSALHNWELRRSDVAVQYWRSASIDVRDEPSSECLRVRCSNTNECLAASNDAKLAER